MASFGLDNVYVSKFKKDLDCERVRLDQSTDFFVLPQLDVIYRHQGKELKDLVAGKLAKSTFGPKPPIEMEIPKSARVSAKLLSLVGPNYFRPGSVLLPEDRVLYHFIGQESCPHAEKAMDRTRVFSNEPLNPPGNGFKLASAQWKKLKEAFDKIAKQDKFKFVLRCDVTQFFSAINQHELVNQLEHQGLPPEMARMSERFLAGLTLDRSSRGIVQGCYGSDVIGNGYLIAIDEFIVGENLNHLRYVDDIYVFFPTSDDLRSFFPKFVKKLRDYDLSLNESKTFITSPNKLLKEETELDVAIEKAKKEAKEKLTNYEEIEVEGGYGEGSFTEILETEPDDQEVDLQATKDVFSILGDFKGDEKDRAEAFCLSFFRKASDPIAVSYVISRWNRYPEKAREYALYLNRFVNNKKHGPSIQQLFIDSSGDMIDFQWSWAALLMRRMKNMDAALLKIADDIRKDGSRHEVVRSLLTYSVCRHGSAARKKEVRDGYGASPLLVQLAIIHSSRHFVAGEKNALLKTAAAHGELQSLMCEAVKLEAKAA